MNGQLHVGDHADNGIVVNVLRHFGEQNLVRRQAKAVTAKNDLEQREMVLGREGVSCGHHVVLVTSRLRSQQGSSYLLVSALALHLWQWDGF